MDRRTLLLGLFGIAVAGTAATDAAAQGPPPWAGGGRGRGNGWGDGGGRGRWDDDGLPGRRRGWRGEAYPPGRALGWRRRACERNAAELGLFGRRAGAYVASCMRGF